MTVLFVPDSLDGGSSKKMLKLKLDGCAPSRVAALRVPRERESACERERERDAGREGRRERACERERE